MAPRALLLLSACGQEPATEAALEEAAPLTSGIDVQHMDTNVKPGDDFFMYVNGTWIAETEIPADKASYGGFRILRDELGVKPLAPVLEKIGAIETYDDLATFMAWANKRNIEMPFSMGQFEDLKDPEYYAMNIFQGGPVDRSEWGMSPQTVNAYYNPAGNEIVFPAAILQPPFFNLEADEAVNYGAIGAVIGHEVGHGFDDKGSTFDGDGKLRNW